MYHQINQHHAKKQTWRSPKGTGYLQGASWGHPWRRCSGRRARPTACRRRPELLHPPSRCTSPPSFFSAKHSENADLFLCWEYGLLADESLKMRRLLHWSGVASEMWGSYGAGLKVGEQFKACGSTNVQCWYWLWLHAGWAHGAWGVNLLIWHELKSEGPSRTRF